MMFVSEAMNMAGSLWECVAWYWLFVIAHECFHLLMASCLGFEVLTYSNFCSMLFERRVIVNGASGWKSDAIRHAGWIGSLLVSAVLVAQLRFCGSTLASILVAADSICSDVFFITVPFIKDAFHCGNFGLLILDKENRSKVMDILKTMVRVTMVRGAQSGGVVTYVKNGSGLRGVRSRVVNGKRTDLSDLVVSAVKRDQALASLRSGLVDGPRMYAGHTRFATTSKATLDGTHPHQWTKRATYMEHRLVSGTWQSSLRNVEVFISHNGDFDSFEVAGVTHPLEALQGWIPRAAHSPCPSPVDSACVAGMMDLLRCKGLWYHSVRFGFLFGPERADLAYAMPSKAEFTRVATVCEREFSEMALSATVATAASAGADIESPAKDWARRVMQQKLLEKFRDGVLGLDVEDGSVGRFVDSAVGAFLDMDLLTAVEYFLARSKGSFGLCVSSSLDADEEVVLAARGQTMSIAFYPREGIVLWGSEQAAVKAALPEGAGNAMDGKEAVRIDLDDLGGEACLLQWGGRSGTLVKESDALSVTTHTVEAGMHSPVRSVRSVGSPVRSVAPGSPTRSTAKKSRKAMSMKSETNTRGGGMMMDGRVKVSLVQEEGSKLRTLAMHERLVRIETNPLIPRLPPMKKDPVGHEIRDIPRVLDKIQRHWADADTLNNITAFWFCSALCKRIREHEVGKHQGCIDLLITGCEVSLWMAEQFASDIHLVFPNLNVKVASPNKLLGLMGQDFPLPCTGHMLHEETWKLDDAVVLLISHSGGTFAPLACANLLQAYTKNIFACTSEYDTQIGKQLRQMAGTGSWNFKSFIFTNDVGLSPCEPCSLSVAAMHQLLTQILLYMMRRMQHEHLVEATGDAYLPDDYLVLEELNTRNVEALEAIVGCNKHGATIQTATHKELQDMGRHWAQHVLETPRAWIIVFLYICVTVIWGQPLVSGIAGAAGMDRDADCPGWEVWLCLAIDALVYVFSAQWAVLLVRVFQGRPLRHRMTGRTVVVGDIPWVAQSVDAFLSKLFACAYSAAAITVFSSNPADHLVHRLTHRVVRGVLLACGRPDGRLFALTSAENAVCLSVNQASSIQSIGSTCESITIGHNAAALPLSKKGLVLPGSRGNFLCEEVLMKQAKHLRDAATGAMKGTASSMLLGGYGDVRRDAGTLEFQVEDVIGNNKVKQSGHSRKNLLGCRTQSTSRFRQGTGERFYGERLTASFEHLAANRLMEFQVTTMRLYESRVASLQRCVSFFVMFHRMGKAVQDFWPAVSCGLLGYDMSRTHSIMRIATTASPVSGAEVRDRSLEIVKTRLIFRARDRLIELVRHRRARKYRRDSTINQPAGIEGIHFPPADAKRASDSVTVDTKPASRPSTGSTGSQDPKAPVGGTMVTEVVA